MRNMFIDIDLIVSSSSKMEAFLLTSLHDAGKLKAL